jgi:acyl-CoA synthetase (AMP-forming)/AMP-acid ligase II
VGERGNSQERPGRDHGPEAVERELLKHSPRPEAATSGSVRVPERVNVAAHLGREARRQPEAAAILAASGRGGWTRVSFGELDRRSDRLAHGLLSAGLRPGERTLVMVRAGVDLITLTYAMFKAGVVPVLIDPGMGRRAFLRCVETTEPTAFVGIPLAQVARMLFPGAFRSVRRSLTAGRRWGWGGVTLGALEAAAPDTPFPVADTARDDLAAVLFTSGSTGPAKGALYTHGNFEAQVQALRNDFGFAPGEVDLAAFPLFSLFDCAFGMTSVIPELDPSRPARCDPSKVVAALEAHACTTAFGSPAIWRRVAPWCLERDRRLPKLRRVLIAGAPVPPDLIEELRRVIAEDGDVQTPYGATEALPVARIEGHEVVADTADRTREGAGPCVGRLASGIELAVIRISDEPIARWSDELRLPAGEVGELCVKGPVVTRGYLNRPEATAAAKIPAGEAVWHRMGDLGSIDPQGRVWLAGRKAERVETATGPLYTDRVEGVFNGRDGVARCALVGVGPKGRARPVLVVEGAESAATRAAILARGLVEAVLFHPRFPVDVRHNAKIHRLELARWAARRLGH